MFYQKYILIYEKKYISDEFFANRFTFADAHVDPWTDDLAGGILFQVDPYPTSSSPYTDRVQAQDRFVNLTYRSPSVIQETMNIPGSRSRPPMANRTPGGLIRGLSMGELSHPRSPSEIALTPFDFDTKKVATHGTLKRLKLVKSPTDTQLFVPNQVPAALLDPGTCNGNYYTHNVEKREFCSHT